MTFRRRLIALGLLFSLTAAAAPASGEEKICWSKGGVEIIYDASKLAGNNNIDEVCKKMCGLLNTEGKNKFGVQSNSDGIKFSQDGNTSYNLHNAVSECVKEVYHDSQNTSPTRTLDYLNLLGSSTDKVVFYRISTPSPVGAGGQSSPTTSAAPPVNGDSAVNGNQGGGGDTAIRASNIEEPKNPVAVKPQTPDRQPTPEQLIATAFGMAFLILLIANIWIRYQSLLEMRKLSDNFIKFKENDIIEKNRNNAVFHDDFQVALLTIQYMMSYIKDTIEISNKIRIQPDDTKNETNIVEKTEDSCSDDKSKDIIDNYHKVFRSPDGGKYFFDKYSPLLICRTSSDAYKFHNSGKISCQIVKSIEDSHFWLIKKEEEEDDVYQLFISERMMQRRGGLIALGGQRTAQTLFGDLFSFKDDEPNAPVRLLRPASVSWQPEKGVLKVETPGLLSLPVNGDARP